MAGDEMKKAASGQQLRIPASAYNAFVDAALDYKRRTLGNASDPYQKDTRNGIIYVRNDAGVALDQYAVVGLEEIVISPDDNEREFRTRVVMSGVIPTAVKHRGRFAILAEPLKAGKIGLAYVDGVCPVKLVPPPLKFECRFADIVTGVTESVKAMSFGSAAILWREGGPDLQWAVVRIGKKPLLFPVDLRKVGGAQGTPYTPATWTYDVSDVFTEELLGSAVSPVAPPHRWRRPSVGWMIEANFGYAHWNEFGELVLGWINEQVDQEPCAEEEGGGTITTPSGGGSGTITTPSGGSGTTTTPSPEPPPYITTP